MKRQLEFLRQLQDHVGRPLAGALAHDAQPQLQVEVVRPEVAPPLKEAPARPRWHLLLQLACEERLEDRLKEDLQELLEPRVEVHWAEHLRHMQRLSLSAPHCRQERPRLAEVAEVRQPAPPHLEEQLKRVLRQKKRRLLRLELEVLPQPEVAFEFVKEPLEL